MRRGGCCCVTALRSGCGAREHQECSGYAEQRACKGSEEEEEEREDAERGEHCMIGIEGSICMMDG